MIFFQDGFTEGFVYRDVNGKKHAEPAKLRDVLAFLWEDLQDMYC